MYSKWLQILVGAALGCLIPAGCPVTPGEDANPPADANTPSATNSAADGGPGQAASFPKVLSTVPGNGAADVDLTSPVVATFASPVDPSSFDAATFRLTPATEASILVDGATARLTPRQPLRAGTTYLVTIAAGVRDAVGNVLAGDITWTFSTRPPTNTAPPTAKIASDRETGHADETVAFDGSQSTDEGGAIVEFLWEFGDGATATGATVNHVFPENGTFAVKLTVTDNEGNRASDTRSFVVRPYWTYAVFMAADNDLAPAGIGDLFEMERVGSTKHVSIVVQAEFAQQHIRSQSGPVPPSALGLTTYETSRLVIAKDAVPNERVDSVQTPIGNRDMGSGAALEEFIRFVRTNHPADHTALVLWNHGSGWQGVCQDVTSNSFMTLGSLRSALRNANAKIDVINFDACLMAMYETLFMVQGHCDFVAFSEETEPGEGDPYDTILGRLVADPKTSPRDLSRLICTKFREFYASPPENGAQSITKSAVDMARFAAVDAAVAGLATALTAALPAERAAIEQARDAAQRYSFPGIRDLLDFVAQVRTRTQTADLLTAVQQVETAVAALVVENQFLTGNRPTPNGPPLNMDRSRGLSILVPRPDEFRDQGGASFQAYQSLAGDAHPAWIDFVQVLIGGGGQPGPSPSTAGQFGVAVVWGDPSADVDLYVFEPNGDVAAPWIGSVSANGFLSGDSAQTGQPIESYVSRDRVDPGAYVVMVNLFSAGGAVPIVPVDLFVFDPATGRNDFTYVTSVTLDPFFAAPLDWFQFEDEIDLVTGNFYSDWKLLTVIQR